MILILSEKDLTNMFKRSDIRSVCIQSFRHDVRLSIISSSICIYLDKNTKELKIIKARWKPEDYSQDITRLIENLQKNYDYVE